MQIYRLPQWICFLSRSRLKGIISSWTFISLYLLYTYSFWDFCSCGWFSLCTIFKSGLFRADFQKECGFLIDSGLFSSKTTVLLRILLVKVVFSNHFLNAPFLNLDFSERVPKRMWFLSRFRLNLHKNHIPFENSAREGCFLKSLFSNLAFQSTFPKRMWFLSRFMLNLIKNHVPFENSAREGGFLKAPESRLCRFIALLCRFIAFHDFHNECGFWFFE